MNNGGPKFLMDWDRTISVGDYVVTGVSKGYFVVNEIIERQVRGYDQYPPLIALRKVLSENGTPDDGYFQCDISWAVKLTPEVLQDMVDSEMRALSEKHQALAVLVSRKR